MLHSVRDMKGFAIRARDGELGSVEYCLFDDEVWMIRFLVVRTGVWLFGKEVLIPPAAVDWVDWDSKHIGVILTEEQVRRSPEVDTHKPVSRQREAELLEHYGLPGIWAGPRIWNGDYYAALAAVGAFDPHTRTDRDSARLRHAGDPHLRSTKEVTGYNVRAVDGTIGTVEGFVIDGESWAIRYLVVDTEDALKEGTVLLAPMWIAKVSWGRQAVLVKLTRRAVAGAPEFHVSEPITREYENRLHEHFDRHVLPRRGTRRRAENGQAGEPCPLNAE